MILKGSVEVYLNKCDYSNFCVCRVVDNCILLKIPLSFVYGCIWKCRHKRKGGGGGLGLQPPPQFFQMSIFGEITANIWARTSDFRAAIFFFSLVSSIRQQRILRCWWRKKYSDPPPPPPPGKLFRDAYECRHDRMVQQQRGTWSMVKP